MNNYQTTMNLLIVTDGKTVKETALLEEEKAVPRFIKVSLFVYLSGSLPTLFYSLKQSIPFHFTLKRLLTILVKRIKIPKSPQEQFKGFF